MQYLKNISLAKDWKLDKWGECYQKISTNYQPFEKGNTPYTELEYIASGFPNLVGLGLESKVKIGKIEFPVNDVLFGKLRPYLQKYLNGFCATDILVIRVNVRLLPEFLLYTVPDNLFVKYAISTTTLDLILEKINQHRAKLNTVQDLSQNLLHQLMTAQIRVDDLDLSAIDLELGEGGE